MPKIDNNPFAITAWDSETTGLDLRHGAKPYFVSTCDPDGNQTFWEWDVDPITRQPSIPEQDITEIDARLSKSDLLVLQNPKFDALAFETIGITGWPWENTQDTLLMGHLLASNQPHDLTTMALVYLGINIAPYEELLKQACNEARRMARSRYPDWRIAKLGLPEMPSAKASVWKYDAWLPRRIAQEENYSDDHPWWTVLQNYANPDTGILIPLHTAMWEKIKERNLEKIYKERLKLLRIVFEMESQGVTLSAGRLDQLQAQYQEESETAGRLCVNIAASYNHELTLPKSGSNKSLTSFLFETLKLEPYTGGKKKKTDAPSMDKVAVAHYLSTLPERSKAHRFLSALKDKRQRDTALNYMEGYKRFWLPLDAASDPITCGWFKLHPWLNPTGTDTLRWSSQNPNEQNISKQKGFNLRYMFGPAPGREWWSCDAQNIELRLPAYEAGEEAMIELFERPDDPPYYGSNHLLAFDILHPKEFAEHGANVKKVYASTLYQWTKNGNFAVQYGAQEASGTADRAYHVPGGQALIQKRLGKIRDLNQRMIDHAEKYGYVETMPDKTVDPKRGYPLLCTRSKWGSIMPTVPLSYHVQGTAMWWMMKAMIRCHAYLKTLEGGYFMVMQVHDELVFDFPKGRGSEPWKTNLPKIRKVMRLMAQGGDDIGVPTPVSCEYHADNWSEGISV